MKKTPIIIVLLFLFILVFVYFKYVYGWMEFRKNTNTPKEFLNHVIIKEEKYSEDSVKILSELKNLLNHNEKSFYVKEYFTSTQLIIDSILYNPDFDKLAAFIIVKNPTYRQLAPDLKYKWYYDGYCYLGTRKNDTIELFWIDGGYRNFYDKQDLSGSIRKYYFRMFASIKDTSGLSKYKYNLDDKRFWNCPIWKEIEDKEIKNQEFEDIKKNHPENIYEPKR